MNPWKFYQKKALQPMRPYIPGEDLSGISVSPEDTPEEGGMIACNPKNMKDQWYVAKTFFEENYGLATIQPEDQNGVILEEEEC